MLLDQSSNQLLRTHFIGRDGFVWWVGQVAARQTSKWDAVDIKKKKEGEELYYNRVKVRIFGYHPISTNELPDDKLPWAHILVPPGESNGVGKIGKAHSYQGGETVMGFFLDGDDAQQPVIFGSLYKSSEIKSVSLDQVVQNSSSKLQPFDPNQAKPHNSLAPKKDSGQNVGTGQGSPNDKGQSSPGNKSGIENIAAEQGEKDAPAAAKLFSDKVNNKTVEPSLCNKNRFARITAAIESLLKKIRNYQNVANTYYQDKIRNKITDFSGEIRKVSAIVSGDISAYIKQGMNYLFEKLSKKLGLTFGGLYPKTKQSEIGKKIDTILEAIYAAFKQLGISLPDLVSDGLTNFIGNAIAPTACAVQNFVGQLLSKVLSAINDIILPLLDQINSLVQGALGSVANLLEQSLNLIGVINQLLKYAKPEKFCPKPQTFSITQGIDFGSVVNDFKKVVKDVGDVGKVVGNIGEELKDLGDIKLDLNSCNPKKIICGAPKIVISGGGGSGASATAVVNPLGQVIGAILNNVGSGYISPPQVSIIDECDFGGGAQAIAVLPPIAPNAQYPPGSPQNPGTPIQSIVIVQPGENYLSNPVQIEYGSTLPLPFGPNVGVGTTTPPNVGVGTTTQQTPSTIVGGDGKPYVGIVTGVQVINPGYGYNPNTTVTVGNCPTTTQIGPTGEILSVTVDSNCPASEIPPVTINSENGAAANLVPVLAFTPVGVSTVPQVGIAQTVVKVVDCV